MSKLPPESVDCVVTSPPYNIGVKYSSYEDKKSWGEYISFLLSVFRETRRVLKNEGSFFLNLGSRVSDPLFPFHVIEEVERSDLFHVQNVIHWIKSISMNDKPCVGHVKPINSARFINNAHEYIFHLTKTKNAQIDRLGVGVPFQDKTNIKRWKANVKDVRCRGNVWYIPYKTVQRRKAHPTAFPVKLPEMCIRLAGIKKDMMVVDPFCGSGATAIACKKLKVSFIGFEIDEFYQKKSLELLNENT